MDNSEFIHRWANDNPNNKTKCGNLSIRDGVLYSYNQPIANRIGEDVFITSRKFSKTTSVHVGRAYDACSGLRRICVSEVLNPASEQNSKINLEDLKLAVDRAKKSYEKARVLKDLKLDKYRSSLKQLLNYMQFLGVVEDDFYLQDINTTLEKVRAEADRAQEKLNVKKAAREKERVEKWLRGDDGVRLSTSVDEHGFVFLRANTDLDDPTRPVEVQTSMGARVPWSDAVRLFKLAQKAAETKTGFTPALSISVGGYPLTEVKVSGDVVVGCHHISYASMESLAQKFSAYLNV